MAWRGSSSAVGNRLANRAQLACDEADADAQGEYESVRKPARAVIEHRTMTTGQDQLDASTGRSLCQ